MASHTPEDAAEYSSLVDHIHATIGCLRLHNKQWSPVSKDQRNLLQAANELVAALEPPDTSLWRVILADQVQAALRTALHLKLAEAIDASKNGELETGDFAANTGVNESLLDRIMRVLVSAGIFEQPRKQCYRHNAASMRLSDPVFMKFAMGLTDSLPSCMPSLPSYLQSLKYANPADSKSTLFNSAMHTEVNLFEWLKMYPERLVTFNESMRAANQIRTKGVLDTLSRLLPDEGSEEPLGTDSEVLLVDVGGGKGDLLDRFRQQRPDLKGRLILQDLPNVVEGRQSQLDVEFMAHDFFETQPVRGAGVYFFRHIFHNWPDVACLLILKNTVAAMTHSSRLVIADIVVPDVNAPLLYGCLDLQMMVVGGMERSEGQWRELLRTAGLQIVGIRPSTRDENETASVIEAVVNSET